MSEFYNNSIFWVEVNRISPNPYQPRKEFNDDKIAELADSIRQYGVLQPLVVTRQETEREDGGISVEYELIAGERRLRASKIAGLPQVPVIIRAQEESNKMKLELAIIENLQREDLNAMDRAHAFKQLVDEFNLKHIEIAKKVGKSREYVSNTLRLLGLPEYIQNALVAREISEGHARPLLMLGERVAERDTLFKEITTKKLTVRESERIARRIATDKARKQDLSPELIGLEKELTETLGTRVQIEQRSNNGGKVHIDYFSQEDLQRLLDMLAQHEAERESASLPTPKETLVTPQEVSNLPGAQVVHSSNTDNQVNAPGIAEAATAAEALKKFNDTFASTQVEKDIDPLTKSSNPLNPFAVDAGQQDPETEFRAEIAKSFAEAEAEAEAAAEGAGPQDSASDGSKTEVPPTEPINPFAIGVPPVEPVPETPVATTPVAKTNDEDELYAMKNFSI